MPESRPRFADLVESIVLPLIEYKDDLEVVEDESDGVALIEISVNEVDAGKVIGRQGRVIKAIRTVVRAAASRYDLRADVELSE